MKIKELRLKNFRGIREMVLNFSEEVNVLVGINGAGKTTILDSLAILLSQAVSKISSGKSTGQFKELDINDNSSNYEIKLTTVVYNNDITWNIVKGRKGRPKPEESSNYHDLNIYTRDLQQIIQETGEKTSIPLFAYYPVNRAVLDIPLRIRQRHAFTLLNAHEAALSGADFRRFFEWFRDREDFENEMRIQSFEDNGQHKKDEYKDQQLTAAREAVKKLTGFTKLKVRRNPLSMMVKKGGEEFQVDQLSDGEKCLLALTGDLARRLAIANPTYNNPLEGHGIILIDEIDLHLHPTWQRMVIQKLTEVFPNCQFIVTTHSPQVISHIKPENLFLLSQDKNNGIILNKPVESYGMNTDRILEDVMGTDARPLSIKEKLHDIFFAIEAGDLVEAKKEILSLKNEIGDDSELVKADVLIKRKEIIGK